MLLTNERLLSLLGEISEPPPDGGETLWEYKDMILEVLNGGDSETLFAYLEENLGCFPINEDNLSETFEDRLNFFKSHVEYVSFFLGDDVVRGYFFFQLTELFPPTEDGLLPTLPNFENVLEENRAHNSFQHPAWLDEAHKMVQETNLAIFCLKIAIFNSKCFDELF